VAAAEAWKSELKSKNRPKIAAGIASPAENEDLFEEGWEDALSREEARSAKANGSTGVQILVPVVVCYFSL
jgi:coatomer subunit beta'